MNNSNNILIYKYDYGKLGLDLEGELFLSYITSFHYYEQKKFINNFIFNKTIFYNLLSKYGHLVFWENNAFHLQEDFRRRRWAEIERGGGRYFDMPLKFKRFKDEFHLPNNILLLLADIRSYAKRGRNYFKKKRNIAMDMGVRPEAVSRFFRKLTELNIIHFKETEEESYYELAPGYYSIMLNN